MRPTLYALAILVLLSFTAKSHGFPCQEGSPDFRLSYWGDTVEQVVSGEVLELHETPATILSDQILETWQKIPDDGSRPELKPLLGDALISITYHFYDGELFKAKYFLSLDQVLPRNQRRLYSVVRKRLTQKYGDPAYEMDGQLEYLVAWVTERTVLYMSVNLRSGIYSASVVFTSGLRRRTSAFRRRTAASV